MSDQGLMCGCDDGVAQGEEHDEARGQTGIVAKSEDADRMHHRVDEHQIDSKQRQVEPSQACADQGANVHAPDERNVDPEYGRRCQRLKAAEYAMIDEGSKSITPVLFNLMKHIGRRQEIDQQHRQGHLGQEQKQNRRYGRQANGQPKPVSRKQDLPLCMSALKLDPMIGQMVRRVRPLRVFHVKQTMNMNSAAPLLPFNSPRGFGGHVIDHAVDAPDFVYDPGGAAA